MNDKSDIINNIHKVTGKPYEDVLTDISSSNIFNAVGQVNLTNLNKYLLSQGHGENTLSRVTGISLENVKMSLMNSNLKPLRHELPPFHEKFIKPFK